VNEKGSFLLWGFLLLVFPLSVPSAPRLVVDTAEYLAGTFDENMASFLKHTFTLKNAGDSPGKSTLQINGLLDPL
jgi:hypothetical protein